MIHTTFFKNPNFLLSLSLSTLVVFHRLLYRFLYQLRSNLLLPNAQARRFRQRHPKVSGVFTSPLSPSIGSSLAGLALLLNPASDRRVTIAVYAFVKALEYSYNKLEDDGWFPERPWVRVPSKWSIWIWLLIYKLQWFGSWLLFPITSGQLLYTFVFDRDCFPSEYGGFILDHSKEYIQSKPAGYSSTVKWPGAYDIIDSISKIAKLGYPYVTFQVLNPLVQ